MHESQRKRNIERACGRGLLGRYVGLVLLGFFSICPSLQGQDNTNLGNYLSQLGAPSGSASQPVESGSINLSNGNLHLEVPLGTFPQKGNSAPLTFALVYDSRIWSNNGSGSVWFERDFSTNQDANNWFGAGSHSWGGWRLVTSAGGSFYTRSVILSNTCQPTFVDNHGNTVASIQQLNSRYVYFMTPDGAVHVGPLTLQTVTPCVPVQGVPTSGIPDLPNHTSHSLYDSDGFLFSITNYTNAIVQGPDGTILYPSPTDTNGNAYSKNANGDLIDTLGRVPLTTTTNCNGNANQICFDLLNSQSTNSQGAKSRYTVTLSTIPVSTAFGQSDITECTSNCTVTVISSVGLPDGTSSYAFSYDSGAYGLLKSVQFPTGGTSNFGYTTYEDLNSQRNRWITSYQPSLGGSWTFTPQLVQPCADSSNSCQQQLTKTAPSGDDTVYQFLINHGAWKSYESDYSGSSVSGGTLLKQENTQYNFRGTSTSSTLYVNNVQTTTTIPLGPGNSLVKQVQYNYDTANPSFGALLSVNEWNYHPSTGQLPVAPDRSTYYTYQYQQSGGSAYSAANILRAPVTVTVCGNTGSDLACGGAGSPVAKAAMSYDTTSPSGVHGNLSQIQKWVGGTSWLNTNITYNSSGNPTQVTDPANNTVQIGYADNFFIDSGTPSYGPATSYAPPATNAYVTSVTLPIIGASTYGYYFGSGKLASSQDPNGAVSYSHYADLFDRLTHVFTPPITTPSGNNSGWSLLNYTSPTQTDAYTGLTTTSPGTNCTGCRHDQSLLDAAGRSLSSILVSDPEGPDRTDSTYDSNGRVLSVTTPYRTQSDSTYGYDTYAYDGLSRLVRATHSADNTSVQNLYGPAVEGIGLSAPLCPASTCGIGYPSLAKDETGRIRQTWTDGFGRIIEVDAPGPGSSSTTTATSGAGTSTITGTEQSFNNGNPSVGTVTISGSLFSTGTPPTYDSGTIAVTVNGITETITYGQNTNGEQINSTANLLAFDLALAFTNDPASPVSGSSDSSCTTSCVVTLTSNKGGTATNYGVSTNVTHTLGSGSFTLTRSGPTLTGGTDNFVYDTGLLNVTINGQTLATPVSYGQTSTASGLASLLATAVNAASNLNALVTATANGPNVSLAAKGTGTPSNYSLSATSSTTSSNLPHVFPSPSFDIVTSWTDLTGGQNSGTGGAGVAATGSVSVSGVLQSTAVGSLPTPITLTITGTEQSAIPTGSTTTVYDQGYVSISLNPCQGTTCAAQSGPSTQPGFQVFTATAAFAQWTTTANIAQNLACVFNASANSPVVATVSGSNITLTLKNVSSSLPSYNYQVIPNALWNYNLFQSHPSFIATNNSSVSAGQTFSVSIGPNTGINAGDGFGAGVVVINGILSGATYGPGDTVNSLTTNLAAAVNANNAAVTATVVNGTTIQLTAKTTSNYSITSFVYGLTFGTISSAKFTAVITPPAVDDQTRTASVTTDTGTVSVTVNGIQASASYGVGSTPESVAVALQNAINGNSSYPVTAWVQDSILNLTAKIQGSSSNYTVSTAASTNQPSLFSAPSFSLSASGSTLAGGVDGSGMSLTASSSSSTFYQYDVLGNLLSVSQAGQTRSYTYDALGRVTSYTMPETGPAAGSGTANIFYTTTAGALCSGDPVAPCRVTDPLGITTTFQYDQLSRLVSRSYSDGTTPTITYCYDGQNTSCLSGFTSANGKGRKTAMKDGSGATGWSYDPDGNVIIKQRTTNAVTQTFSYTHYLDGSIATLTYPSLRTITYVYNNAQRTISAVDVTNAINYATGATYSAAGGLSTLTHGANGSFQGIKESYSYSHRMQLGGIFVSSPAGTVLDFAFNLNQASGNNGLIASVVNNIDNGRTQTFTYDPLNRLASAQSQATSGGNCWGLNIGLDALANLNSETVSKCSGNPLSVTTSLKNQITNTGFSYDLDGRLKNDGTNTYAYDAEDNLQSAGGVNYSYDGNGLRVMKSNGTIYWRGAGGSALTETNLTGGLQSEYVFFNGARIARRDSSGNVYYLFADHLGSTRAATSATGAICYQADYTPYGGELTPYGFTNTCAPNYRFTGYEYDSETQNNYAIARYYNPHLGRFISVDPIDGALGDSQSWNKYAYVRNNPGNFTDPAGMDCAGGFVFTCITFGSFGGFDYGPGLLGFDNFSGFASSPGLYSQFELQQQLGNDLSLGDSWNYLKGEGGGIWNITGRDFVEHPFKTMAGSLLSVSQPYLSTVGLIANYDSNLKSLRGWLSDIGSGKPQAVGQLVFSVALLADGGGEGEGANIALGSRFSGLRSFAREIGAEHLLDFPESIWQDVFRSHLNNPNTTFHVNMEGFFGDSVEEMIMNEISSGSNTGWELRQLMQAGRLSKAKLYNNRAGIPARNPF